MAVSGDSHRMTWNSLSQSVSGKIYNYNVRSCDLRYYATDCVNITYGKSRFISVIKLHTFLLCIL